MTNYIKATAEGANTDCFFGDAVADGVCICDMTGDNGVCEFTCSAADYGKCTRLASRHGVRTKVVERHGVFFRVRKYLSRFGAWFGVAGFFAVIYVMSLYIWEIDVTASENVSQSEVLAILDDMGIKSGVRSSDIIVANAENELIVRSRKISWADIQKKGATLHVSISEHTEADGLKPCSIVAKYSGVIKSVKLRGGKLLADTGDTVKAGDVLISGNYKGNLTRANAEIIADCTLIETFFTPFNETIKAPTDETLSQTTLVLLGKNIPLYLHEIDANNTKYTEENYKPRIFGKLPLPFTLSKREYRKVAEKKITRTPNDSVADIRRQIDEYKAVFLKNTVNLKENVKFVSGTDGVRAKVVFTFEGDIAEEMGIE
ncbi:MAG: sporulation protein YqfD [Oscillospiraceae bacterium]|jgi:similar to stage IV sporulation protein|nr:sporulation protein YqfD [Oscillospiraceae bacterium]